ncbi:EcoAI/FtnUII family type I restriction enzme subunit R [Paludibacter jiangxiensis]|uniref:Type I restriction enzyme, R subunit n=1 Tax=Paludibacter jiangxiensis TaxID=681398 RepID=A0A161M5I2_9BACT|nr:DEAD/DEAH box helicase family protein [Paludibacter jiangxiensis]GAT63643.1 type I restriction enzyme, R subunit [Paludibacter jiangxiensis]
MENIYKKEFSESDICDKYISPAIENAGWDKMTQIRREFPLTPGPVVVRGSMSMRNKKKRKFADYALFWEPGIPIGVVEAKDNNHSVSHGMQQALGYAEIMDVPSAFSSNGDGFASHNKTAAEGEDVETEFGMDEFPSPEVLWRRYKQYRNIADEQEDLILQPYYQDNSNKDPRYYQVEAINRTIEAVSRGQKRLLLVMATGTGKTYTTFQIIWRLWKSRTVKRVLFLVDRNILADQTKTNDFKPFGAVMTKIVNRKIDPSYEIYLGLYQAITGNNEDDKIFKNVSRDFFDLIVIDECHRGSAADDAAWHEILDYFDRAIQLGLTATPKETKYVSNITYFGESVYTYSLKQGIADGFLAPYKVIRIDIDKDVNGWTPPPGMKDDLGNELEAREYNQLDMDRILVLNQRTKLVANRVMQFLKATDPFAKTIIFCEDIDHAERMRKAIVNAAGKLATDNPRYVMRITGDSVEGKAELENFVFTESKFPVIATTSELMTTGVDAKMCKLIVLDKTIRSMTTFKQIIGRGTRIEEDYGKMFFTIMDFKRATELFHDPDFDGDPVVIYEPGEGDNPVPPDPPAGDGDDDDDDTDGGDDTTTVRKYYVRGVEVNILNERVEYYGENGQLITESYKDYSRNQLHEEYATLDDFLRSWNNADKKKVIIERLEEHGIILENLAEEVGKDYGDFDLICHIAFDQPPLTRRERAENVKKRNYFTKYGGQAREILEGLLENYANKGIVSIEDRKILKQNPFKQIGTPKEIINEAFGGLHNYEQALRELENEIYNHNKLA